MEGWKEICCWPMWTGLRESLLSSATVQGSGALNAQSWNQALLWLDSPEPSMPVSLLTLPFPL